MKNFDPVKTKLLNGINLIEASAGTGKTYAIAMLVLRFVVEQDLNIKQILVVTFTKAATEELKDRIRARLSDTRQIILNENDKADENISQWLQSLDIDPQLILQRLNNALLDIDQAGIFTIHGFCQRILAEHALESGQLFDSELTGDISSIKQACSDDFWRKHVYQRTAWEAAMLTSQYSTPDELLASVDYIDSTIKVIPDYEDLELKFIELKQLVQSKHTNIKQSLKVIKTSLADGKFKKSFTDSFDDTAETLTHWLDQIPKAVVDISCFTQQGLIDSLNGQKFRTSKAKPLSSDEQKQQYIASLDIDVEAFEILDNAITNICLIFRRSLLQSLLTDVEKTLEKLNTLSFDNLITRFADALQGEKGELLCQQIRQRFNTALIDEFQDTDQNQWFIFSTLFNCPTRTLYLIGDPKQAIYKFRGADIYSYFAAQQVAQHQFTLAKNWRSHPQLVSAVNTLFSRKNAFSSEHLNFHAVDAAMSSEQGAILKNNQNLPPLVLWQLDKSEKQYWSSGKASTEIRTAIVNEILSLLTDDFIIQSQKNENITQQNIQAKDIAILVRSNTQAMEFQSMLIATGINAIINNKESVFSSKEAIDLLLILQAIAQPSDNTLFKQALTVDWFNLNGQQLYQCLNDEIAMDTWTSKFQDYLKTWQTQGLMAMLQNLFASEKVQPNLSLFPLAERRITNLQHCAELIQQAAIDEHLGINKTLDFLHNNIVHSLENVISSDEQQLRLESDEDAVSIITMHSSKGLEYPIVFCPFLWQRGNRLKQEKNIIKCHENGQMIADLGSKQFEQHRQLALDEELAEDLRVFYVAVTRAKFRCYINWADVRSKENANDSAMAYLLDFANDDFSQQQNKLQQFGIQQADAFEYRVISTEQEISRTLQAEITHSLLSYHQRHRSLYSDWQMSSYTALSSLSIDDSPELPDDKARENNTTIQLEEVIKTELPRGAHTGNVIHDLLENISFYKLSENVDISIQRDKSCLRYGLKTDTPEQIDELLKKTVSTPLGINDPEFKLKNLTEKHCLKEMPFYLSMKKMDVSVINQILSDDPNYQSLSTKTLSGYLTGFIDLICQYKGQYFIMDYKSNGLDQYDQASLTHAMHEHNYGLQYWIYSVVLHQYLKNRLPNYRYQQHFGGIKYLFVRGMDINHPTNGIYQTKPELKKIEQLEQLFITV